MAAGGPGYYGAPQQPGVVPAKKSGENGCLIWGLAGCGVMLLLGVIFVVSLASSATKGKSGIGGIIKSSMSAQICGQSMEEVNVALEMYRDDHKGKYPAKLTDLVPDYLADSATESCGGTVKKLGDKIVYHPPQPKAPDESVVVEVFTGEAELMMQKQYSYVRILKDGQVVVDQVTRTQVRRGSRYTPKQEQNTPDDE